MRTGNNKTATTHAAILDRDGGVIGHTYEAPARGYEIKIAGTFTASDDPVNVRVYKISRSKANLADERANYNDVAMRTGIEGVYRWIFDD
jgi:hypothetical protein